ncbi:MAG: anaerobic selenocysteine-containing dehydrogenase [Psychrobacter glaciei]|jgi:anaerobic selenocysteine-containing dehydrogenase
MEVLTKKTYCRICEAHCGLEVDISSEQKILSVKPDKTHPVSKGYACIKGTAAGALHNDPDRINYPMKRVNGKLTRVSWDQAISEIGIKVKDLRKNHGNRSIAMYQGNPSFFSFQNIMYSSAFLESLNSENMFASHSVDGNNKYEAATQIFGRSMIHPIPDLGNINFFMCFGSNPIASQMSIIQVLNPLQKFKDIEERGGKVIFVDPRKTETVKKVGEQLFIKPGTDVYLLLAMLHVITHEDIFDKHYANRYADGVDEFIENSKFWTPERVAEITGINAEYIRKTAIEFRDADGAALYMSTGVNMGPFGTLSYWLVQGLNFITGNIDRKGGLLLPRGVFDAVKLAKIIGLGGFDEHRTLVGKWHRVAGCFPSSTLAEEIEVEYPDKIRALFVSAGNPVHSLPNGQALEAALKKLDLVVSIDIYPNKTSEHADYVLPATDMLERADFPASHMVLQETPHAQYTTAMVSPKFERRPEWEIFSDLAIACGAKAFGQSVCNILPHLNRGLSKIPGVSKHPVKPEHLLSLLLKWGNKVSLKELTANPQGVLLGPTEPHSFLGKRVPTKNGKVQLWPKKLITDLPRLKLLSDSFLQKTDQLYLIGQRDRRSHNSWMHNNPRIKQASTHNAIINTIDAKQRNITEQDKIEICSAQGHIVLNVHITDDITPGVIAVPHGWGHQGSGLSKAAKLPGENINQVIPGGSQNMEPASGQAIMVGHLVTVKKVVTKAKAATAAI